MHSTCNEAEGKSFRNALNKSDRKKFDEMFDIPRLYISQLALVLAGHIIQRNRMEYFRWWHMNISTGYQDI
jgi:hypothetical protein